MTMPGQPATIDSLGEALLQKVLGRLEPEDQGRAACTSRALCEAVAPLAPALRHYSGTGDAGAVLGLPRGSPDCAPPGRLQRARRSSVDTHDGRYAA